MNCLLTEEKKWELKTEKFQRHSGYPQKVNDVYENLEN